MAVRWTRNDLSHFQNTENLVHTWLLAANRTNAPVLVGTLFIFHSIPTWYPNWQPSVVPDAVITDSLNERAMASFLPPLSLNFFYLKTSLRPLPSSLSFIDHIFCPTETFQRGRESHQSLTRRGQRPHRKLLIPAGMSWALENCQTRWTQCWC